MFSTVLICLAVYCLVCWVGLFLMMKDNAGPGGFGILFVPFAPLLLPLIVVGGIWSFIRGLVKR